MKTKGEKHDHKGTKLLKVGIFSSLMLAPLFAIGFKCAYATFNKNAYKSYSEEVTYKYKTNEVTDYTQDLVRGNIYSLTINEIPTETSNYLPIKCSAIYNFTQMTYYTTNSTSENHYIIIEVRNNGIQIRNEGYTSLYSVSYSNPFNPITFDFVYYGSMSSTGNANFTITSSTYNELTSNNTNGYLDNAFYYAVDEMQESTLFNWTQNTAIYTPVQAMTSGLGITTDAIAILITYWLYLTLIYIVFDIVIELFTWITHTIMNR